MYVHRKKRFASFPSPAGMSLPNSPWAGIMTTWSQAQPRLHNASISQSLGARSVSPLTSIFLCMYVHRKKSFASFPSPAGMSLPNSPWAGIMTSWSQAQPRLHNASISQTLGARSVSPLTSIVACMYIMEWSLQGSVLRRKPTDLLYCTIIG
jgi:hypothetical protein